MAKAKVITQTDSKIRIIGDNILFCNGILTAYYILPLTNYSVASTDGIQFSINSITNLLSGLVLQKRPVPFTIQRFSKVIRKKDVLNNLYETISLYNEEYEMPEEFTKNLSDNVQEYCLLGVGLDQKEILGVEDNTILQTAKQLIKDFADSILNLDGRLLNEDRILASEKNVFSTLRTRCVRASKELVFYNYVSKLYPSYEISYDKLSFINDENFSNILGAVTQTVEDNFGYFVMNNEGVDLFELEPQKTYGSILQIKSFPARIESTNFSMDYPGIQVNIKTVTKEQAEIILKRTRSADRYELEEALKAGAEIEQLEKTSEAVDIATEAIANVEEGTQFCEFNTTVLVTGTTREELKQNLQYIISDLMDRDILPAKSLNQASDFINGYVKLVPSRYEHFTSLQFPLSFQLNSGSIVGDADSKRFVPSIGEDIL